ncbi:response regulator [Marinomonas balearica]|uniref:Hpt domain-containing protein n=1 Tax=Marinomonas balearica TaxID=491947 RepID=A0A4R6MGN7_9GAMM|nr:response regulator [Marinomonas balearica]TDP01078.1 Hpt domain-containing protein [Marinomonas balearica]
MLKNQSKLLVVCLTGGFLLSIANLLPLFEPMFFLLHLGVLLSLIASMAIVSIDKKTKKNLDETADSNVLSNIESMSPAEAHSTYSPEPSNHSDLLTIIKQLPIATVTFNKGNILNINPATLELFCANDDRNFSLEDALDSAGTKQVIAYTQSRSETKTLNIKRTNAISQTNSILSVQIQGFSVGEIDCIVFIPKDASNEPLQSSIPQAKNKVLIVDDSPTNLILAKSLLDEANIPAITADSGNDAIKVAQHEPLSCILMDLQMPDMDGYETAKKIKQLDRCRNTRIIALSGTETADLKTRLIESHIEDFMLKPLNKEKLLQALKRSPLEPSASSISTASLNVTIDENIEKPLDISQDADLLDLAVIEQMKRDIGLDKTVHMKKIAVNEIENRLTILENPTACELPHLQREAHSIKSTAASFGFVSLANIAKQIEHLYATNNIDTTASLILQARKSFENSKHQLHQTLN